MTLFPLQILRCILTYFFNKNGFLHSFHPACTSPREMCMVLVNCHMLFQLDEKLVLKVGLPHPHIFISIFATVSSKTTLTPWQEEKTTAKQLKRKLVYPSRKVLYIDIIHQTQSWEWQTQKASVTTSIPRPNNPTPQKSVDGKPLKRTL